MNAETLVAVTAEINIAATMMAKRWPSMSKADLTQEGWLVALESLPRYDASRGPVGPWLGRALRRKLLNYTCATMQPVHTVRTKEHEHMHVQSVGEFSDDVAKGSEHEHDGPSGSKPYRNRLSRDTIFDDMQAHGGMTAAYPQPDQVVDGLRQIRAVRAAVAAATEAQPEVGDVLLGKAKRADLLKLGGSAATWGYQIRKARGRVREQVDAVIG